MSLETKLLNVVAAANIAVGAAASGAGAGMLYNGLQSDSPPPPPQHKQLLRTNLPSRHLLLQAFNHLTMIKKIYVKRALCNWLLGLGSLHLVSVLVW